MLLWRTVAVIAVGSRRKKENPFVQKFGFLPQPSDLATLLSTDILSDAPGCLGPLALRPQRVVTPATTAAPGARDPTSHFDVVLPRVRSANRLSLTLNRPATLSPEHYNVRNDACSSSSA